MIGGRLLPDQWFGHLEDDMRRRRFISILAALVLLGPCGLALAYLRPALPQSPRPEAEPICPVHPVGQAPTPQEFSLLDHALQGKSQQQVLRLLGQPASQHGAVCKGDNDELARQEGRVVWEYAWGGRLFIFLRHGVVRAIEHLDPALACMSQTPRDWLPPPPDLDYFLSADVAAIAQVPCD